MKFTSKKNGNSIFLPFAGYRGGAMMGSQGYYWSGTLDTGAIYDADFLGVFSDGLGGLRCIILYEGLSVRPVTPNN